MQNWAHPNPCAAINPVIVVGNPTGSNGSLLFGNLTSVTQTAELYDSSYNILTTDILKSSNGSGVVADWSGKIVGLLQEKTEVEGQDNTIQAYGISDVKDLIEHLSNNQDIVYMGIVGAMLPHLFQSRKIFRLESMYQKCHWILRLSQQVFSQVILLRRSMVRQL